jgi:hypothetical protein
MNTLDKSKAYSFLYELAAIGVVSAYENFFFQIKYINLLFVVKNIRKLVN